MIVVDDESQRAVAEECCEIIAKFRRTTTFSKSDAYEYNHVWDQALLKVEAEIRSRFRLGAELVQPEVVKDKAYWDQFVKDH